MSVASDSAFQPDDQRTFLAHLPTIDYRANPPVSVTSQERAGENVVPAGED